MSVVSSSSLTNKNIDMSDLYLELPVQKYGLTDFKDRYMIEMIQIAYKYSIKKLSIFKNKLTI